MAVPVVTLDAARSGTYQRVFDVTSGAVEADATSVATAHGLAIAPTEWKIVDTTALGASNHTAWVVHTITATQFQVYRCTATGTGSTSAKVFLRIPHTMGTGRATF